MKIHSSLYRLVIVKWKRTQSDSYPFRRKDLESHAERHEVKGKM